MGIMLFDVPAESGGALSVLDDYYRVARKDVENDYVFVISVPELEETENIKILRFPWIKKSWLHRLFFDHIIAHRLVRQYCAKRIISLQNIAIPHTKVSQTVLIHNAIPFSEHRFKFSEDRFLWLYQNIIGRSIIKSIKRADHIVVQTQWMKKACIQKGGVTPEKIEVNPPVIDIEIKDYFKETKESLSTFFYPASGIAFKNHRVIIDACLKLRENGFHNYGVIFTLKGDENKHVKKLLKTVQENELPIRFVGSLSREAVFLMYSKSVLLFPSYLETVGLPLLEAKMHGSPIIVTDCDYSREVLGNYLNAMFFEYANALQLSDLMSVSIKKGYRLEAKA